MPSINYIVSKVHFYNSLATTSVQEQTKQKRASEEVSIVLLPSDRQSSVSL